MLKKFFIVSLIFSYTFIISEAFSAKKKIKPFSEQDIKKEKIVLSDKMLLKDGWLVQSSKKIKEKGDLLSRAEFDARGWYKASVPSTVLSVLVDNNVYPDPNFGKNLAKIPGNHRFPMDVWAFPMTKKSPFQDSWWYRKEFQLPESYKGRKIWLKFNGINFKANIWLNGKKIADSNEVAGTFRIFEFDITENALPGQKNTLAVEVFAPTTNDLALSWVDWNPNPPDRNMGIWHDVEISTTGPISIRYPYVITRLDLPSMDKAHLTVIAELKNSIDKPISGLLRGRIGDISFSEKIELSAKETRNFVFSPDKFPQLIILNPLLWWPHQLGPQNLYELVLEFEINEGISDRKSTKFGIREVSSEFTSNDHRVYKFNGKRILIRGAGWASDLLLRENPKKLEAEIRYVKEMNLNTIRLEGKLESDLFYELCDRYGILVIAGWCCCDHWERWRKWDEADYRISEASLRDQILRLRSHPSLLSWWNGSDNPPPEDVERTYLKVIEDAQWQMPVVSSATEKSTTVSGISGVKMTGPYEWVPPLYWYADKKFGGAHGFNTETSPGPAVPPLESLKLMLPDEHLWPIDSYWNYHCGRGMFANLKVFTKALESRYGKAKGVEDYAMKSQVMTYEAERAMFEAFGRNKYVSTGVIQWMLNNAWPSMIWHLYDYYLRPGGGYFGTKKACEPIHIQYSYDDRSIVVVNSLYKDFSNLEAKVKVYDFDLNDIFSKEEAVNVPSDGVARILTLPEFKVLKSPTYFLKLELLDKDGKLLSSNFYWLSKKPDVLNWLASMWYYTPTISYADFRDLEKLPKLKLDVSTSFEKNGDEGLAVVKLKNQSRNLAFFVRLKLTKGRGGEEILPVFWQDNYFSLLPGEQREVIARYYLRDLEGFTPSVELSGWNIEKEYY